MYQLIGVAFCVAGVVVGWTRDPIGGLFLILCAIVWAATTPALAPIRRRPKPTTFIQLVE